MYYINTEQIKSSDFVKKYHFSTDLRHVDEEILLDNLDADAVYLDVVSIDDGETVPMMGVKIATGEPFDRYDNGNCRTYWCCTSYRLVPTHVGPIDLERFRAIVFEMIKSGDVILN